MDGLIFVAVALCLLCVFFVFSKTNQKDEHDVVKEIEKSIGIIDTSEIVIPKMSKYEESLYITDLKKEYLETVGLYNEFAKVARGKTFNVNGKQMKEFILIHDYRHFNHNIYHINEDLACKMLPAIIKKKKMLETKFQLLGIDALQLSK